MNSVNRTEGYVDVGSGWVWYESTGEGDRTLLLLHGGPDASSDYLEPLMARMALPVYTTMWGPNEFTCTGNLMDWDRSDRLGEIAVPTLVTCGRFDEVDPSCSQTLHQGIPGAELVIFEERSHLAHIEEPEPFLAVLRGFLARVETAALAESEV